jgi:peptidoglycan/xylan/chitin deacetylase (PgdA/CDA1 family)
MVWSSIEPAADWVVPSMHRLRIVTASTVLLLAAACGSHPPTPQTTPAEPVPTTVPARPADVQADELGAVPVLMYHRIVADPASEYDRTPDDFRAELERLAREDYVPITVAELAAGTIDVPAGKHPVVLTFDDGDRSVLTLGPDGAPAAGSAVQILTEVAAAHPGFAPVASLYVNADPFGGGEAGERALRWAHEHGFEIGNHTFGHTNLRSASPDRGQQDIARGDAFIRAAVPGHQPTTLALPFGTRPRNPDAALQGDGYAYTAALLVGANPAPSPYSADFAPHAVPRIRSQGADGEEAEFGSTAWLDQLAATPGARFTSDGNPDVISYPTGGDAPADRYAADAVAY